MISIEPRTLLDKLTEGSCEYIPYAQHQEQYQHHHQSLSIKMIVVCFIGHVPSRGLKFMSDCTCADDDGEGS